MSQNLFRDPALTFLISMSFFGLLLVTLLAFNPPTAQENFLLRKPTIGLIFGLLCISGTLAAIFPKQCSAFFNGGSRQSNATNFAFHGTSTTLHGHHPDCEGFSAHVFKVKNKTFCTACTGLALGGLIALAGTALYFFGDLHIEQNSLLVVLGGVLGVGSGLFQFKVNRSFVRLFLNTFFVLGAFLVLIGVDELSRSVFLDLFLVSLSFLWLFTRISLSQWDHKRICYVCDLEVCKFRK